MNRMRRCWLGLLLLFLHLAQSSARVQPLQHRRRTSVAAKSEQSDSASRELEVAGRGIEVAVLGAQGLRQNTRLRRRRAHNAVGAEVQIPQERRSRRRRAGEKLALQAGEEAGDPPPAVKGTKKKKKKAAGKKKMSKEDAIAAAQEAQAAAAAALLKGISHEDAAKAAQAALAEKGATELTKGVLGAEDVEKAEGRPAPFKKKDASNGAATDEAAGAADAAAAAAPAKKKKKKKKAAATGASAVAAKTDEATGVAKADTAEKSMAEPESDLSADSKPAAAAEEPVKPAPKKKKKKKVMKKKPAAAASDRQLRTLDSNVTMLSQQGEDVTPYEVDDDVDDKVGDEDVDDPEAEYEEGEDEEEEEFELSMTGTDKAKESAKVAASLSAADPGHPALSPEGAGASEQPVTAQEKRTGQPGMPEPSVAAQAERGSASAEQPSTQPAAPALGMAAAAPAQPPAKAARPWFPLPEKREISTDVLYSLINASAAAVKRDAAPFVSKLHKHFGVHQPNATAEGSGAHRHHEADADDGAEAQGKKSKEQAGGEAKKEAAKEEELPEVKQLPPWFKDISDAKDRAAKVGSGHRHKSRQRALGAEEKWLRTHQRHLAEVREDYDVIFYGDDIVEAWRGTFVGQKYGPFNDIPAVWDKFFGSKGYKALAAGIAGDGVEQLLWRLKNGELPPIVPPKVIVIACGTNSKGMSGECAVPAAEESAAQMREALQFLRESLPDARIVALAPLPKGDYWPNRCTPAFDIFNANLQAVAEEHPQHVFYEDYGTAFLTKRPATVWQNNSAAPVREEINEMYMPDALHPSAAGMRLIAGKLEPLVSRLVAEAEAAAQSA